MTHSSRTHITQTALLILSLAFVVDAFSQRRFEWSAFYPESIARQNATKIVMPNYPEDGDTTTLPLIVRVKLAVDGQGRVAAIRVRPHTRDPFKRAIADSVSDTVRESREWIDWEEISDQERKFAMTRFVVSQRVLPLRTKTSSFRFAQF